MSTDQSQNILGISKFHEGEVQFPRTSPPAYVSEVRLTKSSENKGQVKIKMFKNAG